MKSDREWIWWGRHDPLWAVNSRRGKERGAAEAWREEEFLESGRRYFAAVAAQWRQYGMGHDHVAEIGCGAGRITAQLLTVFDHVTAIDVSPDQMALAHRLLGADAERVRFTTPDPQTLIPAGAYDGLFSCEVFQHFSSFQGIEDYCRAASALLVPGGSLCIHVPVWRVQRVPLARYGLQRAARVLKRLAGGRRMMEYRMYPAPRMFDMLRAAGYVDCELRVFPVADHDEGHTYFFARTPSVRSPAPAL